MLKEDRLTTGDLAYLRRESLQTVLLCLVVVLYIWCLVLFRPINDLGPMALEPVLLAAGLAIALAFRQRNPLLAAVATILGIASADLLNMWLLDTRVLLTCWRWSSV